MFARMFPTRQQQKQQQQKSPEIPSVQTSQQKQKSSGKDAITSHEDIDFYWDNPQALTGKKQDILDIIQKQVSDRNPNPIDEWKANPEKETAPETTANQAREPLFPKNSVKKDPSEVQSAL